MSQNDQLLLRKYGANTNCTTERVTKYISEWKKGRVLCSCLLCDEAAACEEVQGDGNWSEFVFGGGDTREVLNVCEREGEGVRDGLVKGMRD